MTSHTIVVTGATGHIGSQITAHLLAQNIQVRAIGRNEQDLKHLRERRAIPFIGSLDDPAFLTRTFQGADGVFFMIPPSNQVYAADWIGYQTTIGLQAVTAIR